MQATHGGVGVPGGARAVPGKDLVQPRRVVGQMVERHGAVLDEGDGLAVAFHRHGNIEPGGPKLGDLRLEAWIERVDDGAPG